jgi:DNA-binding XRE family transcriptional regulator
MFWRQLMAQTAEDHSHTAKGADQPEPGPKLKAAEKAGRAAVSQQARKSDDLDLLIGKRLRERRILLAITQEELAQRIQLSPQQLQKYEIGENRVSAARLFRLSQILEVPITWFFAPVTYLSENATPNLPADRP